MANIVVLLCVVFGLCILGWYIGGVITKGLTDKERAIGAFLLASIATIYITVGIVTGH